MGRWVLGGGLLALVALALFATLSDSRLPGFRSASVIEDGLLLKCQQALIAQKASWAHVEVRGQIATVSGRARTGEERDQALRAVAAAIWGGGPVWGGIVHVHDRTTLAPEQKPFVWSAVISDGRRVRITGFVPSEAVKADLNKLAQSLFPTGVEDFSRVARGVPHRSWSAAVSWTLQQLARLSEGSELSFSDLTFVIRGVTDNPGTQTTVKERITQVNPPFSGVADVALVGETVPAPPAPPAEFVWSARMDAAKRLYLSGFAPNDALKADIVAGTLADFPGGIEDTTTVTSSAPEGDWGPAAKWAVRLVSKLDSGEASFRANLFTITGATSRQDVHTLVTMGAKQFQPPYRAEAQVTLSGAEAPPAPDTPSAPPDPEVPAPIAPIHEEREAQNRSANARQCQGGVDAVMAKRTIAFASGSSEIAAESFPMLDALAAALSECPDHRVIISGHTDNSGPLQANRTLSKARANAVAAYLRDKGISNGRMLTRGWGPLRPIASNDTEQGRSQNRRIQFTVID